MDCVLPPPIDDRDLLAYLDGAADNEVADHLARCPHCFERAEALSRLEHRLLGELYRVACPAPEVLGEYHLQMLPQDQSRDVQQHVSSCHACARELAELQGYLADLTPDLETGLLEGIQARVRVWIAKLVEGETVIGPALHPMSALAGTRGADEGPRLYEAGPIQLSIETQEDAERSDLRSLLGLLIGADPAGIQVVVSCKGVHLTTVPIDELGNFVVSGMALGSYDLMLSGPQVAVHVRDLIVE